MNQNTNKSIKKRNYNPLIWAISIIATVIILAINYLPRSASGAAIGIDLTILPLLNVILNGFALVFLVLALVMIKRKNIKAHRRFIFAAFLATILFLISYLTYHSLAGSTTFGGEGIIKTIYYFVLITHISLAIALLPLSLITLVNGLNMEVPKHKKIARWTMPIWLYVSLTGIVVYFMISPYY